MADFHVTVHLGLEKGGRFQRVLATVNPDSFFTVMPSPFLEMLGVAPLWTDMFQSSDGTEKRVFMAEVRIRLDDRERTTICAFGDAESQPLLGKHTLDAFGLTVDEAGGRLVPARLSLP